LDKSRLCYVIMPFSSTTSCTEGEWTRIFDELIRPTVEDAGLGYECRRSEATRGNIIEAIIGSLHEAHVVIADLTDQNPNVFYELGVRHALTNKTILLAQDMRSVPFDLQPYAVHVYEPGTRQGQADLRVRMVQLLGDVDKEPDRPDNPVSDYLARRSRSPGETQPVKKPSKPARQGVRPLAGPDSKGFNAAQMGRQVGLAKDMPSLRAILKGTLDYFGQAWPKRILELTSSQTGEHQLRNDETYDYALPLIDNFSRDVGGVESFALALVETEWDKGTRRLLTLAQEWITYSEQRSSGITYKAIQGAPALCAFRLICLLGTKAVGNESFDIVQALMTSPLETKKSGGQPDMRSLVERVELFYPDGLLGRGDLAGRYLSDTYAQNKDVEAAFTTEHEFFQNLARFLFLACLGVMIFVPQRTRPLYPSYCKVRHYQPAIVGFVEEMRRFPELLASVAGIMREQPEEFRRAWPGRAARLTESVHLAQPFSDFSLPNQV
jgi:hypothetical protein